MLKWIGIEESLFDLENQKENVDKFVKEIELAGMSLFVLQNDTYNIEETAKVCDGENSWNEDRKLSEGLFILNGEKTNRVDWIGKLPIIGFDIRNTAKYSSSMPVGIRYVIESFEGIEEEYLQMVYHRFYKLPLTIAQTKRGILREITIDDVSTLWKMGIFIQNMDGSVENRLSLEDEMEFVKAYISNMYQFYNYGMWLFCPPRKSDSSNSQQNAEVFGIVGFDHIDPEDLPEKSLIRAIVQEQYCLQIGYHIYYNYRRQGYGLEALQKVVAYGQKSIGVDRVILFIEPQNKPSIQLAKKAGFTYLESTIYQEKQVEVYIVDHFI